MTQIADIMPAGEAAYERAASLLQAGELVALPTETVYGLAALASDDTAVCRIYEAKGRPSHNPLIAHVFDPKCADMFADIPPLAQTLIDAFWPGPLTLVLPKKKTANISQIAGANLDTIAIRCPVAPWSKAFSNLGFHGPIVMPSANLSGHVSPTTAQHVFDDLGGKIKLIIDGGPCKDGLESTVLAIDGDRVTLLRPGVVGAEALAPYISELYAPSCQAQPIAPGMLESHYAPRAALRLNAENKTSEEAYLGFGVSDVICDMNLSERGDLGEASQNLYACLRALDKSNVMSIAIAPVPKEGLGVALNDRLKRAAAPKTKVKDKKHDDERY